MHTRSTRALGLGRVLLAGSLLLGVGCARRATPTGRPATTPSFPLVLADDDGVRVTEHEPPRRIVTWGPSNTEILFGLGLGARVVGVSGRFDDFPPRAAGIPEVGDASGVRPNVEKVVALHPDLVLNAFLGGEDWKGRLRTLGIPVFSIYATNFDDALHDLRTVGQITGSEAAARHLTASLARQAGAVAKDLAGRARVSCFLEEGYPGIYTVGPRTFVFDMLRRAGCDPVTAAASSDFPTWSLEKLIQENPDVYLVASESGARASQVTARPGFGSLGAVRSGRVFDVDSDLISRPGPRLGQGLLLLAGLLARQPHR